MPVASKPKSAGSMPRRKTSWGKAAVSWASLATLIHDTDQRLRLLADKARTATDEAKVAAHLGIMELEQEWESAHDALLKQVGKVNSLKKKAHTKLDVARVKAHLASADAGDATEELRPRPRAACSCGPSQ